MLDRLTEVCCEVNDFCQAFEAPWQAYLIMAETIIGRIKEFSSLNLPKHRLPLNAFLHLLAAITAYQINPIKPKFKLPSTYPLAISA